PGKNFYLLFFASLFFFSLPFALRPSPFALRPSPFALRPSPFAHFSKLPLDHRSNIFNISASIKIG
ncbi:MAG: hypothetical protein KDI38_24500, partial [Calditrichaeota bacterium]|nr:hypothetical protein [Calditrichota bacterium]